MGCGMGHRCGSDLVLLWLWLRSAAAVPIQPLAWELPYVAGVAIKKKKRKKEKEKNAIDFIIHKFTVFSSSFPFFFLVFLWPHPWHMEVPRLRVESEL